MPARLVLDTNVCLDLFVFADPRCARLWAALREGGAIALTDEACRDEWRRVLAYPQWALAPARRAALLERYDACFVMCAADAGGLAAQPLPRCADPDDQKFLELAASAGAEVLLSRDKALLKLGPRLLRAGLFRVLTPQAWMSGAL